MLQSPSKEEFVTLVCVWAGGSRGNTFSIRISETAKVEKLAQEILHKQRNQLHGKDASQLDLALAKKAGDSLWVTEDAVSTISSFADYPRLRTQARLDFSGLSHSDIDNFGTPNEAEVAAGRGPVHVLVSIHVNGPDPSRTPSTTANSYFSDALDKIRTGSDKKISLRFMKLDDGNMADLVTVLESRSTDVEELDLRSNNIGDRGIESLCPVLKTLNVKQLLLGNNNITDKGAKKLVAALTDSNDTQTTPPQSPNSISTSHPRSPSSSSQPSSPVATQQTTPQSAASRPPSPSVVSQPPSQTVAQQPHSPSTTSHPLQLELLDLHQNPLRDDGAKEIARLIQQKCVEELDMRSCKIKGSGAVWLANALKGNEAKDNASASATNASAVNVVVGKIELANLNLMGNSIEERGTKKFKDMFKENSTVTLLLSKHDVGFWLRWRMRRHNYKVQYQYC